MSAPGFFDARPLVDPVDAAAVSRFSRAQRTSDSSVGQIVAQSVLIALVVPLLYSMAMGLGYVIARGIGMLIAAIVATACIGGIVTLTMIAMRRARAERELASYRLAGFAAANSMEYFARLDAPPLPGMIYTHGSGRMSTDIVRGTVPRFVEFGNYQYTTSNGRNSTTHRWGYVAIKLDVPLPHIVLDALSDNTLGSDVAAGFSSDQRLSLEGDFDRYFSLFCPSGYEADALYLFTPDVMARFVDNLAQLNVEVVDNWMFFYTRRPASTLDPATWSWLFGAVSAMMTKLDQWARWRDDRLRAMAQPVAAMTPGAASALPFAAPTILVTPPPPGVAPPGQRLRTRSPWLIVAIVLALGGAVMVLPFAFVVIGAMIHAR